MNRKVKLSLVLALFCITFIGCASLMKAFKETTPSQVASAAATTAPLDAAIPMPYGLLGAPLIALLTAIGTNWWRDKQAASATPTAPTSTSTT